MIPHGLGIKNFPSFGSGNVDFKNKWEAILNKRSLDLILLLIETKAQNILLQLEIKEVKQKISCLKEIEQNESLEKKLQDDIDKLSGSLRQMKQEKLR